MPGKKTISICWLRRDLRLVDHAALFHALNSGNPVLILFIFDKEILDHLNNKKDARVTFIYQTLMELNVQVQQYGSSMLIRYGTPEQVWKQLLLDYNISSIFVNEDYEPYGISRDKNIATLVKQQNIAFYSSKDHVLFAKNEIIKSDGAPYSVFTPYFRKWEQAIDETVLKAYPTLKHIENLFKTEPIPVPSLDDIGFEQVEMQFPALNFQEKLKEYEQRRDYPADDATSRIGLHLRFGTVSIRAAARTAIQNKAHKWLSELAWRDFYMMILWHFPHISESCFKPAYNNIKWRNNEAEFQAWCAGETGYPLVDAGMKQLNATGYMHNRVRMLVASFLTKHLLIDWKWGEAYFADKLLDYEMASNIGGWQWACGCGNDAAPYFRVFSPELQAKKFDPKSEYIYRWAPAYKQQKHVQPIVEHAFARERILKVFKEALNG